MPWHRLNRYGLYGYSLYRYGLYRYGLYRYGLYRYGLYCYGLYSYDTQVSHRIAYHHATCRWHMSVEDVCGLQREIEAEKGYHIANTVVLPLHSPRLARSGTNVPGLYSYGLCSYGT